MQYHRKGPIVSIEAVEAAITSVCATQKRQWFYQSVRLGRELETMGTKCRIIKADD